MSNEVLELAHEFKGTADHIREKYNSLSEKYEQLEQHVAGIEVAQKGWRPTYGGEVESKSDPMLGDYLRKGIMPGSESKSLSVTNDGQGVTVRSEWSDRIFKLVRETSPIRSVASVLTTSTNALEVLVDRDEPQSAWIGEIDARTKTDASFMTRQVIGVNEHFALPEATLQMLEDSSFDVEVWLQSKVASRFTRQENAAFFNGDGNGQPRGLLTYQTVPEATFAWGADPAAYEIGATFSGIDGDIVDANGDNNFDALFDLVDSL
ncbi:phage major capsid protein, partial [Halomonas sp. RA08-2]|uniref:phage major capsid protein n=1 Tax=Halomonas sp. RA08-2 TaxID=3440842 RepID=UPI003EEC3BA9